MERFGSRPRPLPGLHLPIQVDTTLELDDEKPLEERIGTYPLRISHIGRGSRGLQSIFSVVKISATVAKSSPQSQ